MIAKTLHSVHNDLESQLNLEQMYSRLNQEGILPSDSLPDFLFPVVPDHSKAKVCYGKGGGGGGGGGELLGTFHSWEHISFQVHASAFCSTTLQVNNLMMWLPRHCTLQQFERFIELVKETSAEGGEGHDDLHEALEENFKKFRNNHATTGDTFMF